MTLTIHSAGISYILSDATINIILVKLFRLKSIIVLATVNSIFVSHFMSGLLDVVENATSDAGPTVAMEEKGLTRQ